jgi:anti-sigma B factor antagonist
MEITYSTQGNLATVSLVGQLWQRDDLKSVDDIVESCIKDGLKIIVIDADRLSFINSQGLGFLVRTHARLKESGGKLVLFSPRESVLEVMELSGFNMFMTIAKTENDLNAACNLDFRNN